jgi:hypothetical protein
LLTENITWTPMAWMVEVDGFPADARGLPRPLQVAAYERGLRKGICCIGGKGALLDGFGPLRP